MGVRRTLATVLTLGLLSGFVFVVVLGLLLVFGVVDLGVAVAAVFLFNAVMLLVGPRLDDFLYRYLYDMDWVTFEAFRERSPASAAVVEAVTDEYGYDAPKLGVIRDSNPTAFTYGSGRFPVDEGRLYREFARDLAFYALPAVGLLGFPVAAVALLATTGVPFSAFWFAGGWLASFGVGTVALALYRYPRGEYEPATVVEVLADPYASPVRGRRVAFDGELVGRGVAGYAFSEDVLFEDATGLMLLEYESWLPWLGTLLFSLRRVPELVGEAATVEGWYFRGVSTWTGLRRLRTGGESVTGFVHLGGLVGGGFFVAVGVLVALAGLVF